MEFFLVGTLDNFFVNFYLRVLDTYLFIIKLLMYLVPRQFDVPDVDKNARPCSDDDGNEKM